MRLYRLLSDFEGSNQGISLAIGNFDGFHIGHQAVISTMQAKAQANNCLSAVMIFEPQPLELLGKVVPPRLFSLRDKLRLFKAAGIDLVFCISFDRNFASLDDESFVALLKERLNVRCVTVGSLFSFGRGGKYTIDHLKVACARHNIECSAINGVQNEDNVRISSTLIRSLIKDGDFMTARKMIGRDYSISGRVVRGNQIGRTLGFPTANVNLNRKVCPLAGVYAVQIKTIKGVFNGVANVGLRPTISKPTPQSLLEVNIFNFNFDIYGSEVIVYFAYKIRDEKKFSSLEQLVEQMSQDRERAKFLMSSWQNIEQIS